MVSAGQDAVAAAAVEAPLLELAAQQATGCLVVTDESGDDSLVWLRDGRVYAVSVPGRRPLLGVRLVSSGAITPEALAAALEVQRTELRGWRLGELLVHLGYVQRGVIDEFVTEQMNDQIADLLAWNVRQWQFRNGERTRQDMTLPHEVADLLDEAHARRLRWASVLGRVGGPGSVPDLDSSAPPATQSELGPHEWAVLCKADGVRTVSDLADECGFTLFETARLVADLTDAGLLTVARGSGGAEPRHADVPAPPEEHLAKVVQLHPHLEPEPERVEPTPPHRPAPAQQPAEPVAAPAPEPEPAAAEAPAFEPFVPAVPEPPASRVPEPESDRAATLSAEWAAMAEAANLLSRMAADSTTAEPVAPETELAELADFGVDESAGAESGRTDVPREAGGRHAEPVVAPDSYNPALAAGPEAAAASSEAEESEAAPEEESDEEESADAEQEPEPAAADYTDTASLLRELSSLGLSNDDAGPRHAGPRTSTTDPRARKKRGFLGR